MNKEFFVNYCSYDIFCIQNIIHSEDPPVLFIHGLGTSGEEFKDALTNEWMEDQSIYIIDLLGYGKSDKPDCFSYSVEKQALIIHGIIKALGLSRVNVVAHSMGGTIGICLSKMYPEVVEKLILIEGNIIPNGGKISKTIKAYGSEEAFSQNYKEFIERYNKPSFPPAYNFYKTLLQTKPFVVYRTAVSTLETVTDQFYHDYLKMELPRYYIAGADSYYKVSKEVIDDFNANNIGFSVVSNATHSVMTSNPEEFYKTLYSQALI